MSRLLRRRRQTPLSFSRHFIPRPAPDLTTLPQRRSSELRVCRMRRTKSVRSRRSCSGSNFLSRIARTAISSRDSQPSPAASLNSSRQRRDISPCEKSFDRFGRGPRTGSVSISSSASSIRSVASTWAKSAPSWFAWRSRSVIPANISDLFRIRALTGNVSPSRIW